MRIDVGSNLYRDRFFRGGYRGVEERGIWMQDLLFSLLLRRQQHPQLADFRGNHDVVARCGQDDDDE